MEEICRANFRWTREELVRAMQHHQRLKIRRGVVLIMKIFSAVLLLFLGLLLVAWILLPSASVPPIWAVIVLAAFSLYWLTFDIVNAWYWSFGFNKRPDANIEINWRFSGAEITCNRHWEPPPWDGTVLSESSRPATAFFSIRSRSCFTGCRFQRSNLRTVS